MLQIGSVVDGKYKILNEVGHGGMSVVYLAINERANKTWAIKEVRKDGVVNFEAVKQGLVVETDMLKRLNHPHLPSIIDVIDTDDSFLIVMDYIEGKSLQSVLSHGGAQPQEQVIEWGKQLCDVLGYLHTRQPPIIYRDMKPANVMLKPDGNITLIDFGTAREFKNRSMVEDTTCLGTRGYAAPEQFGGQGQTDARTDIYCLGATLYHLLTGHSPAEPPYEIKSLSYWDPSYAGSGIEKLIQKCCQQDPSARFQSCEELMYALEHLKDEDDQNIRIRKRKWISFLLSAGLFVVGVLGMIGFGLAKGSAKRQTYDYYINQAKEATSLAQLQSNCKQAMEIDAEKRDAFEVLIEKTLDDGDFSEEEMMVVDECLNSGSPNHYVELLRTSNPAAYEDLQYQLGIGYFFLTGQQPGYIKRSVSCFEVAKESENLYSGEKELSEILYRISYSYANLTGAGSKFTRNDYSYKNFWDDLNMICSDDMIQKIGKPIFGLALCEQVAYQVNTSCNSFRAASITQREMDSLLEKVQTGINQVWDSMSAEARSQTQQEYNDALQALESARNTVKAEYTQTGR